MFHGTTSQPESGTHGDLSAGMHGVEPVSYTPTDGGEAHYGTPTYEEPTHVSSEEHSFEDAGHAAGTGTRAVTTAAPMWTRWFTTAEVA